MSIIGDTIPNGMYFSNLPVDVMHNWVDGGSVIAVDVGGPLQRPSQNYPFESSISGWRILLNRLNPFSKTLNVPNVFGILNELGLVNSKSQRRHLIEQGMIQLYIAPKLEAFPAFDFSLAAELAQTGYQSAIDAIATLPSESRLFTKKEQNLRNFSTKRQDKIMSLPRQNRVFA